MVRPTSLSASSCPRSRRDDLPARSRRTRDRLAGAGAQVGEVVPRKLCADVCAVPSLFEHMRVGIERHARTRMAEDAADLHDVEADVDDQMAGEGVTQVVKARPPAVAFETRVDSSSAEHALGNVVVKKGRAVACREHVVGSAREPAAALVLAEDHGELGKERDLAHGRTRLRRDPVRRDPAAATR